jgi:hypothetical protein
MPIDRTSHLIAPAAGENVRRRSFYRSFIQFLCSNLGLILIVVGYSIGGAFLFQLLEQYIELQNCQQGSCKSFSDLILIHIHRVSFFFKVTEEMEVTNMSETMYNYVALDPSNTTTKYAQIVVYLTNFTNDVYTRRNNLRYTGQDCETTSSWNFPSALLFTITVITSIGYGYVTPVSW